VAETTGISSKRIAIAVAALLCTAMVPNPADVPRFLESPAAKSIADLLQSSNAAEIAAALEYPSTYTAEELARDREGVAGAVAYLIGQFGRMTNARPTRSQVVFIEIGVAGGSTPFWWQAGGEPRTRQYIYDVEFEKFGRGFLKVLTHVTASRELPVGFAFGLDANSPDAESRMRVAMGGLMDLLGVPKDHPARSMPLPKWEAPAISK
jgi:hypothetical protein